MTTPKVIAYIASSVNGYLADSQGTEEWVQPESWKRFVTTAQRYGNVVAGSKTYRLLMDAPQLEKVVKVCVSATHVLSVRGGSSSPPLASSRSR